MIDLQVVSVANDIPSLAQFQQWAQLAMSATHKDTAEITIRLVDDAESQQLNWRYRRQNKPTNVLAFTSPLPQSATPELTAELDSVDYLGDLVINAPLVIREAVRQNKASMHHWAHLVIHGCLHLQGYDHIKKAEAAFMESLEIALLAQLGIANPY